MEPLLYPHYFPHQLAHLNEPAISLLQEIIPKDIVSSISASPAFCKATPLGDLAALGLTPHGEGYLLIGSGANSRKISWVGLDYLLNGEGILSTLAQSIGLDSPLFADALFAHAYIGLSESLNARRIASVGIIVEIGGRLEHLASCDPHLGKNEFVAIAYDHIRTQRDFAVAGIEAQLTHYQLQQAQKKP